jgi:2-polyprenyl-3-methyl-5-hydroxy-6-metoxy-1,4-benzoquinol methylase
MTDYRQRVYENYASTFQSTGETFDMDAARRWGMAYDHYLKGWLPVLRDAAVAEIGCGGGRLLRFFADRGYSNLVGVDLSPSQVRLASQVGAPVVEGDAVEFLEAHVGAYDLIVGLDIIEHFRKDELFRFLDGCFASLRPGGRLILQTPNADSPFEGAIRYGDISHETAFNPNSLCRLLALVGLRGVEAREQGPVLLGYSPASTVRAVLWQGIRLGLLAWNLVETGGAGSGVLTRVFLATGVKPG